MAYSHEIAAPGNNTYNSGYGWYNCTCCPYGYHIDLDFVRYCESISQETDRSGSAKRRKDRRRQRQSMEVLLGLTPPVIAAIEQNYKPIQELDSPDIRTETLIKQYSYYRQDGFDDAVYDFEQTLQRSKKRPYVSLPDGVPHTTGPDLPMATPVAGVATPNDVSGTRDFDTVSIESCGLSPAALQNIREQMALSLERTKELEDQVKLIPGLKRQLSVLREENQQLLSQLKTEQTNRMNIINANYVTNRVRSQSFSDVDNAEKVPPRPPPRRDFGVMCGVLTRNVGVGHQYPNMKSVSTATINGDASQYSDKWYNEKVKFLSSQNEELKSYVKKVEPVLVNQITQTITAAKNTRDCITQTPIPEKLLDNFTQTLQIKERLQKIDEFTQTIQVPKQVFHVGSTAKPSAVDTSTQIFSEKKNAGVHVETPCEKCTVAKISIGVGSEDVAGSHLSPVSLASLTTPRSKSFNLGDDKLNLSLKNRTVGCQSESFGMSVASQYEIKTHTKACQNIIKTSHRGVQHEYQTVSKITDTKDLGPAKLNVACEANVLKNTAEIGCNTAYVPEKAPCNAREKDEILKKEGSPTPSRIPRPQVPTTPVEIRKFRRQDTYTKIPAPTDKPQTSTGLSGLDLPLRNIASDPGSPLETVKSKLQEVASSTSSQNGDVSPPTKVHVQEITLPVPESTLHLIAQKQRQKVEPSKEMQAAMKVVNDSLQKNQNRNVKNQLKNATNIIQQEWFKISSLATANPLDVEDYLDAFEDFSSALLEYIVNMTDASGNTAMHYAVSHGNFDVVSILLDSKVCDINKPNTAGYTSVMLVSLAEVRSQTHANVVRRLFKLADVNIRAKQHGQTALMLAVSHGRLDMVKMLLEAGADINIQDEDGSTALMCAAEHGHVEIVQHFLSQPDCDSSITDLDGSTALKIAMDAGHRHIGVLLYAHERNFHGGKQKKSKSTSASPKTPSSPLPFRSTHRALPETKHK